MSEIKILFKNGKTGYFRIPPNISISIENIFDNLGNAIRDGRVGIIELIDLTDDKRTLINIGDITTFGYSLVHE